MQAASRNTPCYTRDEDNKTEVLKRSQLTISVHYLESKGIADSIMVPKVLCMDKLAFVWKKITQI